MYKVLDLADYVLWYCSDKRKPITSIRLQKILFLMWCEHYDATGESLFDEHMDIKANNASVFIPTVHYKYCHYAYQKINLDDRWDSRRETELQDVDKWHKTIDLYAYAPAPLLNELIELEIKTSMNRRT